MAASEYGYSEKSSLGHHIGYLGPALLQRVDDITNKDATRIFDLGCGNGSIAALLAQRGHMLQGVDPSESGIAAAQKTYPGLQLEVGSAYDDLAARYGTFPLVVSLEVAEHVYSPRDWARALFDLVEPGGQAIISTPYHGYWKNLALALTGKLDDHFTALWDHGHIKFWSIRTLGALLHEAGFCSLEFHRLGRIRPLAKTMMVIARK
jgi:2-polyprenyl-3-methyl-5-hydroxy-6-metoxy-1,4-benzoquinol methylase